MYPTIGKMFELTVDKYPERQALVYPTKGQSWSYREWDERVNKLAHALIASGIGKGDVVSVFLFNTSEFVTTLFAVAKIGAVFNPINFRLAAGELAFILNDAGSKAVVFENTTKEQVTVAKDQVPDLQLCLYVDEDVPEFARSFYDFFAKFTSERPDVEVKQDDWYILMYTSGTTGRPKGVIHRHRDMLEQNMVMISDQKLTCHDRGLCAAPLNHSAELHCLFLPRVHIGACNVLLHHFDPQQVLSAIAQEKISVMFGAPTMLNMLLQLSYQEFDLSSLRLIGYGGAAMAPAMVLKCHEAFGAELVQYYGMTELGPAVTVLYPDEQLAQAGAAGKALLNHEVRVVRMREGEPSEPDDVVQPGEVGEVIVKGPCMMVGYYNRPEATEKALYKGWYHSSDLARIDEKGYIWIIDRADDMIISGAETIYPREVEDVLYSHPNIVEVAVSGLPDPKWGKIVAAFVVPKRLDLTAEELNQFLLQSNKLASFKRPRQYVFCTALPKTPSGKIQKFKLDQLLPGETA